MFALVEMHKGLQFQKHGAKGLGNAFLPPRQVGGKCRSQLLPDATGQMHQRQVLKIAISLRQSGKKQSISAPSFG